MATPEEEMESPRLMRLLPGGDAPARPEVAWAVLILLALGITMGVRKGFKPVLSAEHVHSSTLSAVNTFLAVIVVGGLWRVASAELVDSDNPWLEATGKAMSYVY